MIHDIVPFFTALFCVTLICGITSVIFTPKDKTDAYYEQDVEFSKEAERLYWVFWGMFLISFVSLAYYI